MRCRMVDGFFGVLLCWFILWMNEESRATTSLFLWKRDEINNHALNFQLTTTFRLLRYPCFIRSSYTFICCLCLLLLQRTWSHYFTTSGPFPQIQFLYLLVQAVHPNWIVCQQVQKYFGVFNCDMSQVHQVLSYY
jgi:hypothetical protein